MRRSPALDQGKVESVTYKGAKDADIQMWVVYPRLRRDARNTRC